jgi:hypothetical protein
MALARKASRGNPREFESRSLRHSPSSRVSRSCRPGADDSICAPNRPGSPSTRNSDRLIMLTTALTAVPGFFSPQTVTVTLISPSTREGYLEGSLPAEHPASKAGGGRKAVGVGTSILCYGLPLQLTAGHATPDSARSASPMAMIPAITVRVIPGTPTIAMIAAIRKATNARMFHMTVSFPRLTCDNTDIRGQARACSSVG